MSHLENKSGIFIKDTGHSIKYKNITGLFDFFLLLRVCDIKAPLISQNWGFNALFICVYMYRVKKISSFAINVINRNVYSIKYK